VSKKPKYYEKTVSFGGQSLKLYSLDGVTWSSKKEELHQIQERHEKQRLALQGLRPEEDDSKESKEESLDAMAEDESEEDEEESPFTMKSAQKRRATPKKEAKAPEKKSVKKPKKSKKSKKR
jgi:hypothetical protein